MGPAELEWPTGRWESGRSGAGRSWRGEEERKVGDGADRWGRSVWERGTAASRERREAGLTSGPGLSVARRAMQAEGGGAG